MITEVLTLMRPMQLIFESPMILACPKQIFSLFALDALQNVFDVVIRDQFYIFLQKVEP